MVGKNKGVDHVFDNWHIDCMALSIGFSLLGAIALFMGFINLLFLSAKELLLFLDCYGG